MAEPINQGHLGQTIEGNPHILPLIEVDAPNGTGAVLVGEIIPFNTVADPIFYVVVANNCVDAELVYGFYGQHTLLRKKAGEAWVRGDRLTLKPNATGTKNDYIFQKCATDDPIMGIAQNEAASADVQAWVLGPFRGPFELAP